MLTQFLYLPVNYPRMFLRSLLISVENCRMFTLQAMRGLQNALEKHDKEVFDNNEEMS